MPYSDYHGLKRTDIPLLTMANVEQEGIFHKQAGGYPYDGMEVLRPNDSGR